MGLLSFFKNKYPTPEEEERLHYERTHPHRVETIEEFFQKQNIDMVPACSGILSPPQIEVRRG